MLFVLQNQYFYSESELSCMAMMRRRRLVAPLLASSFIFRFCLRFSFNSISASSSSDI